MRIAVYQNGQCIGWVRRVSVARGNFDITQNRAEAKRGYRGYDECQYDIDFCTRVCGNQYGFMIDEGR